MRRRQFLATGGLALALTGCSAPWSSSAAPGRGAAVTTAPPAAPAATAAPEAPGGPQQVMQRSTVPVLCYHQVREQTAADSSASRSLICPPAVLEQHLRALTEAGMVPVTSTQLVDHLELGSPLPPRPVLISFDDASAGHATAALPILQRLGMPATFFVMTVVLDKPDWLSRDQVRRLDDAGMTIGVHTWDHQPVTTYAAPDWSVQLERPKAELEKIVGHPVDVFAFPYGAWNPPALPHVQQAGYRAAFQLTDQAPDPQRPLFTVRRVLVSAGWDTGTLLQRLAA